MDPGLCRGDERGMVKPGMTDEKLDFGKGAE
jgi:hypothetical protein